MKFLLFLLFLLICLGAVAFIVNTEKQNRERERVAIQPPVLVSTAPTAAPVAVVPRTQTYNDHAPVSHMQSMGGNAGGGAVIPIVQLGSDEARKFSCTIKQVIPGGAALASGCFYDVPPSQTTEPEKLRNTWTQAGEFYINGLPEGLVDHQEWKGWLVREGAKTFTTALGTYRTVPLYRVIADPPFVPLPPPKPGAWMQESHGALDQNGRSGTRGR